MNWPTLYQLEDKYDRQFKVVFDAIGELMISASPKIKPIGFHPKPFRNKPAHFPVSSI
jgi:hypothetical protein